MTDRDDYARLTAKGLTVEVELGEHDGAPCLRISGMNCDLEGIAPGEYLLTEPSGTPPDE